MFPPTLIQAQGPQQPPPPPFPMLALARDLGLREDQHQALRALLDQRKERLRALHEGRDQARLVFHRVMVDVTRSQTDLETALRQVADAERAEALEAHALLLDAAKLLTPEQRATFQRLAPTLPPPPPPRGRGEGAGPSEGPRGPRPEGRPEGRP